VVFEIPIPPVMIPAGFFFSALVCLCIEYSVYLGRIGVSSLFPFLSVSPRRNVFVFSVCV
jgi:hypothetical protein